MAVNQNIVLVEKVGLILSLVLLALGTAELGGAIDIFPVTGYILVLWIIALLMWLYRR